MPPCKRSSAPIRSDLNESASESATLCDNAGILDRTKIVANEQRVIHVQPDSELARVLDDARDAPLLLEKDGIIYRLSSER
jgi:hypothetical protein